MKIRPAKPDDAQSMSAILAEILTLWQSDRPRSPKHVLEFYILHPDNIQCSVAADASNNVLGFQALKLASRNNPYDVTAGWGIIGTYVKLDAGRRGIGALLFAASLKAAKDVEISNIDATIGANNKLGLGYYEAMGFQTYRTTPNAICKRYKVSDI